MNPRTKSLAFFDVDTQVDFMEPDGRLFIKGAADVAPNVRRLVRYALDHGLPVVSSVDAHAPDDPEFSDYPPHCVSGTPGQRKIEGTTAPDAVTVKDEPTEEDLSRIFETARQVVVETPTYSAFANPHLDAVLKATGAGTFVVFGVATDVCVRCAVRDLIERGYSVQLVTDAIQAIDEAEGRKAVEELRRAGVQLITTGDIVRDDQ